MTEDSLKQAVEELRNRLELAELVGEQDREALNDLAMRVELMLSQSRGNWDEGVVDELEKQMIQYEEEHPVIARVISQILTTLNGMGL